MSDNGFITLHKKDGTSYRVHEDVFKDDPVDMRDRNVRPTMSSYYKLNAQQYYTMVEKAIQDHSKQITDLDVTNAKQVVDTAQTLFNDLRLNGHSVVGKPSCYRIAAGVAAILDKKGVEYNCYAGVACPKGKPEYVMWKTKGTSGTLGANHVWIQTKDGKKYEWFDGDVNDISHFTINDEIHFKKGAR